MKLTAHYRAQHGFTLIEIIVAIFLFGMVVAAIYSSWNAVMRGSKAGLSAAAVIQRSRIALRTMEDALTCARSFVSDREYYSFDSANGDDAFLSFVARLPASFPRSGKFGDLDVRRLTFSLEPRANSESDLVLRQTPLLMDMDEDEQEHPVVLAKNVKKFEMEFWDMRTGDWLDEWTQTNQLPPMVKLTLEFGGDEARSKLRETSTRVVALPGIAVPTILQVPWRPRRSSRSSRFNRGYRDNRGYLVKVFHLFRTFHRGYSDEDPSEVFRKWNCAGSSDGRGVCAWRIGGGVCLCHEN